MGTYLLLLAGLLAVPILEAQVTIIEVKVEGNSRLHSEDVVRASGLRAGGPVGRPELDAATKKLFETGLFRKVNYSYEPKAGRSGQGWSVTLHVMEEKADTPVQLDIPNLDEAQFWPVLKRTNGLVDKTIPDNDQAQAYYQHAIEAALASSNIKLAIAMTTEADLRTGKMTSIFHPADAPSVSEIAFQGNQQVASAILTKAVAHLLVGKDYSERRTRQILELNLRPIYEEKALLKVAFPAVKSAPAADGQVSILVTVDEERPWTLGRVDLTGSDLPLEEMRRATRFPEGRLANWTLVKQEIEAAEAVLKRDGYLFCATKPDRNFHEDTRVVDVTLRVDKGKQFHFGSLELSGLDAADERQARALWAIHTGDLMNGLYMRDYLRALVKVLGNKMKGVSASSNFKPGNVVDVVIAFK